MVRQVDVRHRLRHMLQRGLVNRGAGNVVERQRRVHIVDVIQEVEEVQVLLVRDAAPRLLEVLLHALQLLRLLLVRVAGVGQHQFGEIRLGNVALLVRVLALELQRQNFPLQLVLELEELLDGQLLVQPLAEEERGQRRINALNASEAAVNCNFPNRLLSHIHTLNVLPVFA